MARMRESAGAERACPAGQLVRVYCGRHFSVEDIGAIGELIEQNTTLERTPLSRRICEPLQWRQPNGALKAMSCRVALLRMQADDLIRLPPRRIPRTDGAPRAAHRGQRSATAIMPAGARVAALDGAAGQHPRGSPPVERVRRYTAVRQPDALRDLLR